ncbi:MAG: hypothetical protein WA014_03465, partial [Minisyncoccia bacterium]
MSSEGTLILLGVATAISPFSGIPSSWLAWVLPVFGILIAIVAYRIRRNRINFLKEQTPSYTEAVPIG